MVMETLEARLPKTTRILDIYPDDALTVAAIRVIIDNFNGDVNAYFQSSQKRRPITDIDKSDSDCLLMQSFVKNRFASP